jgi:hypothetical protein
MRLAGVVYHGGFHYVARIVSRHGTVWKYDGMQNGGAPTKEGEFESLRNMNQLDSRVLALVVYSRD